MQKIELDQNNIFSDKIGIQGLERLEFFAWEKKICTYIQEVRKQNQDKTIGWPSLPFQEEEITEIAKFAKSQKDKWKNIIVLGIGGSSLGSIAIQKALASNKKTNLIVLDNIDPDFFTEKLEEIDWRETLVIVISKSGTTPETMAQFYIIESILKHELKEQYNQHIIAITDKEKGELKRIAIENDYKKYNVPDNVGGRFSVLTTVGLLPAALIGVDIMKLCHGAQQIHEDCFQENLRQNPAAQLALVAYLSDKKKGKRIHVMCPYSNKLSGLADWYAQLLAESLGKNEKTGLTPVAAIGTTDQHSQLQLWNEGPNDKVITFLEIKNFDNNIPIPYFENDALDYLSGKSLNELISAERYGTQTALTRNKRPNQIIEIPNLTEETFGQLIYLFEMQIALLGKLYNIDAYSQPGVESGKIITKKIMSK